ncbi:MAG: cytochrome c maturation protein CcmE [Acidobacteria bacterium]|nr:cytochrome c maturation protein CcmE [Acidobacteriota bacterium]
MSFSPKVLVLVGLLVASMVFLMARSVGGQDKLYYLKVDEFLSKPNDRPVRLAGFVSDGTIAKDQSGLTVRFVLRDESGQHTLPVVFDARSSGGRIPDTFVDGSQVVVSGRLGPDRQFQANQLLAKCPSKYEAAAKNASTGT